MILELPRGSYVPVFRANTGRWRAATPLMRWQFSRKARENFHLVMLIVVVTTFVSLSLDLASMALGNLTRGPAVEKAQVESFLPHLAGISAILAR